MADWFLGQRVVCVDAARRRGAGYGWEIMPAQGVVYTIRAIMAFRSGRVGFLLDEISNCHAWYDSTGLSEMNFASNRFRPVVEPRADISVFERTLDRVNKREPVDA